MIPAIFLGVARRFRPVLHPRAGVKLPPELRAGSVGRIAGALLLGVEDPGFELLLRRIDRGPILGGNRIEVFTRGAEAFASMQAAAASRGASASIRSFVASGGSSLSATIGRSSWSTAGPPPPAA